MASLLEQLRSARTFSVEVLPGQPNKRLRFLRPTAAQMPRLRGGITQELLAEHALPWEGITEADVLPGGIGGDSPAAFDAELLRELLEDRPAWFKAAAEGMVDQINAWLERQDSAAKN